VEPEWLVGKIGSREGLFPEAFVELADDLSVYDTAPRATCVFLHHCSLFLHLFG